jgi:cytoskeletal protein CcmA (bactofilin family)
MNKIRFAKSILFVSMFSIASGAQAVTLLLGGSLDDQTVFANTYVTSGAGGFQTIYGNVLANQDITIGASGEVTGSTQSRDLTTGAGGLIGVDVLTSGDSTLGASSIVSGNLQSGGAVTLGASAGVTGTVQYGTVITNGAGATSGSQTQNTTAPVIANESAGVSTAQNTLNSLATTSTIAPGDIAVSTTFLPGVYNVGGLLSTTAGITLTLDATGGGDFVFNVDNYLSFGANTVINVVGGDADTSVVWNATAGYVSIGADANIVGTILAHTYVSTGAGSVVAGTGSTNNLCGGVYSATSYVTVGASATVGGLGCSGTIGEIPLPAAAWLFGSGLIGLVGVARRKKAGITVKG